MVIIMASRQCLVPWILLVVALQVSGDIILEPPMGATTDGELVVDKGTEFSLRCRGDSSLAWSYNDYSPNLGDERSKVHIDEREEHGQFVTTLTLEGAYFLDTGYIICHPKAGDTNSSDAKAIYIYVRDSDNPLAVNDTFVIMTKNQGETVEIPCKPTDPSLEMVLTKDGETEMKPNLSYQGMLVRYDKRKGYTFLKLSNKHDGEYSCHTRKNGIAMTGKNVVGTYLLQVLTSKDDIEKPHLSVTPTPVMEGLNVTFECSVHYDFGVTIFLNWSVPDPKLLQSGRIHKFNATSTEQKMGGQVKNYLGMLKMMVYEVSEQDVGSYTCHVIDNNGNENNNTYKLQVHKSNILELSLRGHKRPDVISVNPGTPKSLLVVDIKAHPRPKSTQWYDNKMKPIIGEQTPWASYEVTTTNTESKLIINHPDVHSSGTYTLVVNNDAFNKSINATIQVQGMPDLRVNGGREIGFYLVDQEHTIDCEVFAWPKPNITWFFKPCESFPSCSLDLEKVPPSQYSELEVNSAEMPLKSTVRVWSDRTGDLTCKACNELGCQNETTTLIAADVLDGFSVDCPKLVVESDNITLSCGASKHNYTKNLEWFYSKNNGHLSPVKDLKKWFEETNHSYFVKLNIPHVTKEHSGNYVCIAEYLFGRKDTDRRRYSMHVKSLEKPLIHKKNISTKWAVVTGRKVSWHCWVHGTPPPTIIWYKDGEEVSTMKKSNMELKDNNQTLVIQVGLEDDAIYTCKAVNKAGSDTLTFEIELTDKPNQWLFIFCVYVLPVLVVMIVAWALWYARGFCKLKNEIRELKEAGLLHFEEGNIESLNPELDVGEQADLLPYDRKKWEFPRDKLKLGKQLGSGAFGVVLKAEAYELEEPGVATTVAVKMVKRNCDVATIKALASELKIMIHLGKHLNVVNVLGACTGDLNKRELLVLVEYCQYGNLQKYLFNHRGAFINQVNPRTGMFDPTLIQPASPRSPSGIFPDGPFGTGEVYSNGKASMRTSVALSHATDTTLVMSDMSVQSGTGADTSVQATPVGEDGYLICRDHEWRNKDRGDYKDSGLKPICTQDLICWGFQIARGMEYLASRKVLHGDLAARNILLADENIVKICDFGFSKSMYRDTSYHKKGDGPLPVKWMALESIRDRVFSTQSDVWAYGVTLWEMFSLSTTPYPGMEVDERLFTKLEDGYRMEQPKYATKHVFKVMVDCWHVNPHTRPSFTELAERMGGMLEDTVRTHYVDLNDPFLQENNEFLAQQDYLSMLRSPSYANWVPAVNGYTSMKPAAVKDTEEAMELTPMLDKTAGTSAPDSPDGSPAITKPIGNNYVNVAQVMSFSNPSYHNLGRPKQSPYINMPDSSDES